MKRLLLLLCYATTLLCGANTSGHIVIINGTSCAGKSTITSALACHLQNHHQVHECTANDCLSLYNPFGQQQGWCMIHIDDVWEHLVEQEKESSTNNIWQEALDKVAIYANFLARAGHCVLVDTSLTRQEDFADFDQERLHTILIYAPLKELCKRDSVRALARDREYRRNVMCRYYILECFANLYGAAPNADEALDTLAHADVYNAVTSIQGHNDEDVLPVVLQEQLDLFAESYSCTPATPAVAIVPRFKHDLVISSQESLGNCVQRVVEAFPCITFIFSCPK